MIPSSRLVVLKSTVGIVTLLGRPSAALCSAAGHVAQRPPAFIRGRTGLFDRAADARNLADEVIQPRLDLITNAAALLGQVQPSPYATRNGAYHSRRQHTRSLVHVGLLRSHPVCFRDLFQTAYQPGGQGCNDAVGTKSASPMPSHELPDGLSVALAPIGIATITLGSTP